jgi:nuclear cap-binding protein subunit 1
MTSSVMDFLDAFAQMISQDGVKSDFFTYLVLHSLPWIGSKLQMKRASELEEVLKRIELYLGRRSKQHMNVG